VMARSFMGALVGARSLLLLRRWPRLLGVSAIMGTFRVRGFPTLVGPRFLLPDSGLRGVRFGLVPPALLAGVRRLLPTIARPGPESNAVPALPTTSGPPFVAARAFPLSADGQRPISLHYLGIP